MKKSLGLLPQLLDASSSAAETTGRRLDQVRLCRPGAYMTTEGREMQGRALDVVCRIHVRALSNQRPELLRIALSRSSVQRRHDCARYASLAAATAAKEAGSRGREWAQQIKQLNSTYWRLAVGSRQCSLCFADVGLPSSSGALL